MAAPWILLAALAGLDPAGPAPARFEFRDASAQEGRELLTFRPLPLGAQPVRPLKFMKQAGAGARYGLLPLGPSADGPAVVWEPPAAGGPALWLDADGDGRLSAGERHVL